jgi:hypothetical protein
MLTGIAMAQETAAQLLARSMQRTFPVNVIAVILQKDPQGEGFQRVKIERNRQGLARCTILAPLRMSGITSVDNGERLMTFLPDRRLIIDQQSPGAEPCEVDDKIALAKRNYTFKIIPSGKIAGRETICVQAVPRFDDLEIRRYYLDSATTYPLRVETFQEGNEINVMVDTKDIAFPKVLDRKLFELEPSGDVSVQTFTKPKKVVSGSQAQNVVGFMPLIPDGLPLGFKVQEIQFSGDTKWKPIVIRMTDGLARATLYQWDKDADVKVQAFSNSSTLVYKNLKLMLVSDLSAPVRMQLLRAFLAQASVDPGFRAQRLFGLMPEAGLQASLELVASVWAFAGIDSFDGLDHEVVFSTKA